WRFVVCSQNHDQVGNRACGERISALCDWESIKLAAGLVLLSPHIPLLFMGEEYGETSPFLYFVSHLDSALVEAVRQGRRAEFSRFAWIGDVPDPQDEETFSRSKLNPAVALEGRGATLHRLYRSLIELRRTTPSLGCPRTPPHDISVSQHGRMLDVSRGQGGSSVRLFFHFGDEVFNDQV